MALSDECDIDDEFDEDEDDDGFFSFEEFKSLEKRDKMIHQGKQGRLLTSVEDLRRLKRHEIQIQKPNDHEVEFEVMPTEEVPKGVEAEEHGYWSIRVRTDIPEAYHFMRTVNVSEIFNIHSCDLLYRSQNKIVFFFNSDETLGWLDQEIVHMRYDIIRTINIVRFEYAYMA